MDDPLLISTLDDAEKYVYRAQCKKCKRAKNIDLMKLRNRLGNDFPVRDLRTRLVCECGHKGHIVTYVLRDSSVGREYAAKD